MTTIDSKIENYKLIPIKCINCGERHFRDEDTFITVYGNITIGLGGGVVGNNFMDGNGKFDNNWQLKGISFICRDVKCFRELLIFEDNE